MSNIGLKSESTGKNYKKSENMLKDCSDDTGAFTNLNKMEKDDMEGASGTQLARSLTVFSTWIMSESKPGLDGKNVLSESRSHVEDYWNNLCYVGKEKIFASCKVPKESEV